MLAPTKAGFSEPSTSTTKRLMNFHQPPAFSSREESSALARIRESTGTGAGKRALSQP